VPAAHYTCGGIVTDISGRTDLPGLYAVGETTCTGLHGANRLASNSLLECVVIGRAVAQSIGQQDIQKIPSLPAWDESRVGDADEEVVIAHNWMSYAVSCGITSASCAPPSGWNAQATASVLLKEEIDEYYRNFRITRDLLELRNLVEVASLIVNSALTRRESRGLHFSRDFPDTLRKPCPA